MTIVTIQRNSDEKWMSEIDTGGIKWADAVGPWEEFEWIGSAQGLILKSAHGRVTEHVLPDTDPSDETGGNAYTIFMSGA